MTRLQDKLETLPPSPGVYLLKDAADRPLYIGKARDLRKRVLSYSRESGQITPKIQSMLSRVADLDIIITATEKEAVILEANLIKKHRPRYNVILRDDKNYLALRIDTREEYPRLSLVRRLKNDGALYFGPYASARAVRDTLKVLNRMFPLRQCSGRNFRKRTRPCLNYQMGRCLGLCVGKISPEDYARVVEQAVLFLRGRTRDLQKKLREEMQRAAADLQFEKAALYRDRLEAIDKTLERQRMVSPHFRDQDVVGVSRDADRLALAVLFIRGGRLVGSRIFDFDSPPGGEPEVIRAFIQQYYGQGGKLPEEILIGEELEEQELLCEWLSELKGQRLNLRVPRRGDGRHLLTMAEHNAANHLLAVKSSFRDSTAALVRLAERLGIAEVPRRLECVDISNIQGRHAVGSLVVFQDGKPDKSGYRRYRIRAVDQADDPAMMMEVLGRRFRDVRESEELPDLLVVDGGKGQLSRALAALRQLGLEGRFPVVALAKEPRDRAGRESQPGEKLYIPGRKNPLSLNKDPGLLFLLDGLRDEAHRFAISYYQKRHRREALASRLDQIPGVGPKRRRALIRHFGSLDTLGGSSVEAISKVSGISRKLAEKIHEALQE